MVAYQLTCDDLQEKEFSAAHTIFEVQDYLLMVEESLQSRLPRRQRTAVLAQVRRYADLLEDLRECSYNLVLLPRIVTLQEKAASLAGSLAEYDRSGTNQPLASARSA